MVVCADLASCPPPSLRIFLRVPSSLVGYFKPPRASKPQTTSQSGAAAGLLGTPQRPQTRAALLAKEPEVGGRAVPGTRQGWDLGGDCSRVSRFHHHHHLCPSFLFPTTHSLSSSSSSCKRTHTFVCTGICVLTQYP